MNHHRNIAPGPIGSLLFGNLTAMRRDALGLLRYCVENYGDVVRLRLGPHVLHLLNHPDDVQRVLSGNRTNYDKSTRSIAFTKRVCGESLLTSDGVDWEHQRRLVQPAFHQKSVASFGEQITEITSGLCGRWKEAAAKNETFDVASEMMRLTFKIAGQCLFGTDVGDDATKIENSLQIVLEQTWHDIENILPMPGWIPTSRNRRFQKAIRAIDETVYRIINERRKNSAASNDSPDLLSLLLHANENGASLSDQQLRNETLTLLLAGHETTANALSWTFYLLSQNPGVEEKLISEIETVLGGRIPDIGDLAELKYTNNVVRESLRLYPPVWIIERRVIADDEIGGFHIPTGSSVVISPYALHRHKNFWSEPEVFRPERFEESSNEAFIPFGAGSRSCIGNQFALTEARLVLTTIYQKFHLRLKDRHPVVPQPGLTLRPRHGLLMHLQNRKASS